NDVRLARRDAALGLLKTHSVQALLVVLVGLSPGLGGLALLVDLLFGAEAAVSAALFHQLPGILGIQIAPLGLDVRSVLAAYVRPLVIVKPCLAHGLVDQIDRAGHFAFLIGILNAQDEPAAMLS